MNDLVELVSVVFDDSDKTYDYINKYSIPVKTNDYVCVKVGTGGVDEVKVSNIATVTKEHLKSTGISYKYILENKSLKSVDIKPLQDGHSYVYDVRILRKQWDTNSRDYVQDWSDIIKTCICSDQLQLNDKINYEDTMGRIVNIRQVAISKTKKMIEITPCEKQKFSLKGLFKIFK